MIDHPDVPVGFDQDVPGVTVIVEDELVPNRDHHGAQEPLLWLGRLQPALAPVVAGHGSLDPDLQTAPATVDAASHSRRHVLQSQQPGQRIGGALVHCAVAKEHVKPTTDADSLPRDVDGAEDRVHANAVLFQEHLVGPRLAPSELLHGHDVRREHELQYFFIVAEGQRIAVWTEPGPRRQ